MKRTLVDGEGKPIPEDSWGGDLDPVQTFRCEECGVAIPFGKFCPEHLQAARQQNEEFMARRRQDLGIDPNAQEHGLAKSHAPERELDMDALAAQERARAQAIVTPGQQVPQPVDHMAPTPLRDRTRTVGVNAGMLSQAGENDVPEKSNLILPATTQERIGLKRRGDEFLIGQAVMWMNELRGLAEEGKVNRELAAELLQICAELTYALAGLLR